MRTRDICVANVIPRDREFLNKYIYKRMSEGSASILDLKDRDWSTSGDLNLIRAIAENFEPFRIRECSVGNSCCGVCARQCKRRCVQDVLTRISMEMMSGNKAVKAIMSDSRNWTYDILVETVDALINRTQMSYAPQPVYITNNKSGKIHRMVNSDTGDIIFRDWPETGLCPYCMPATTMIRRNLYHKR